MIDASDTGYGWPDDLPDAFAEHVRDHQGWHLPPGRVLLTGDVLAGLAAVLRALTQPGDGVVVNPPVYPPFFSTIADVSGRRVVHVPLAREAGRYVLDLDGLAAAFARPDVTAYVLCNPHNPTGGVLGVDELTAVAGLAARHGVTVVADEIHGPLALPGAPFVPYLSLGEAATGHAVTLTSASKAWNLPGLKCAMVVAGSGTLARTLEERIPMEVRVGSGLLGIRAAAVAFREGVPWLERARATIDRNRALLGDLLAARLPEVGYAPPAASYLAWLDCRALGLGDDPAEAFLDRGRVALSPGPAFGPGGAGHVRLNMATSAPILAEIVDRMAAAVH
jgi:cystathionine beta-lyase